MRNVSIVVPVHNHLGLLRKALLSLACQSQPPGEIIVSDDGSDEDVSSAVRAVLPALDCPVFYVWQPRKGFRAARCRNNGILASSHDIIVFHDQDIVATSTYLAAVADTVRPGTFATGYAVRLTQSQSLSLSESMILGGHLDRLMTAGQRGKIVSQFVKDLAYHHARRRRLIRSGRPKLRSGVFGAWRADLFQVDGFDENYIGWGNEDDDLGRRLYASGVCGRNPCLRSVPLHLHHAPHHRGGVRTNLPYTRERMAAIKAGAIRAGRGLTSRGEEERPDAVRLR